MRRTLLAITAVLLATIGTTLLYVYVSTADNRAQQRVQTVEVLVATADMDAGTDAAVLQVRRQQVPAFGLIPGAISSARDVQGKVLTVKVLLGQQLSGRMFGPATAGGLEPGRRAVSVQIGDAERVASLIKQGSNVAVLRFTPSDAVEVLPSAKVLSADGRGIVTFDLSEAEAQKLLRGVAQGRLVLEILGG
jgi:pilus assembly protein CpaB